MCLEQGVLEVVPPASGANDLHGGLGVGGDHSNKVLYLKGLLKIYRFSGLTVNVLCHLTSI